MDGEDLERRRQTLGEADLPIDAAQQQRAKVRRQSPAIEGSPEPSGPPPEESAGIVASHNSSAISLCSVRSIIESKLIISMT